jgi:hypothetical protein
MSHDLQPELQWITRIAAADSLLVGGENPGYGIPPSLNTFYTNTNTTTTTMMASALRMAKSCNFTIFYWAHDIHLHDGTLPFTLYTTDTATTQLPPRDTPGGHHQPWMASARPCIAFPR